MPPTMIVTFGEPAATVPPDTPLVLDALLLQAVRATVAEMTNAALAMRCLRFMPYSLLRVGEYENQMTSSEAEPACGGRQRRIRFSRRVIRNSAARAMIAMSTMPASTPFMLKLF